MQRTSIKRYAKQLIGIGLGLIGLGFYCWYFAPDWILGIDSGWIGSLFLPLGIGSALYGLYYLPKNDQSFVSFGEKQTIIALGMTLLIASYFVLTLARLEWNIDIHSREMQRLLTNIIIMIVGAIVVRSMIRKREQALPLEDERDQYIQRRANKINHATLVIILFGLIGFLGLNPHEKIAWATPVIIAHILIGTLMLADILGYSYQWWLYRQERS